MSSGYPGRHDLVATQRQHLSQGFNWKSGGIAVDLTGYTADLTVAALSQSVSSAGGGIVLGGSPYNIVVTLDVADDALVGFHEYELWLYAPGGAATPVMVGEFRVRPSNA